MDTAEALKKLSSLTMNEESPATFLVSEESVKFMIQRGMDHYNNAIKDGLPRTADFWDGYIKGIRNLIAVAEAGNG